MPNFYLIKKSSNLRNSSREEKPDRNDKCKNAKVFRHKKSKR